MLAFAESGVHAAYAFAQDLGGALDTWFFLLPSRQAALVLGLVRLLFLGALAVTSTYAAARRLRGDWQLLSRLAGRPSP